MILVTGSAGYIGSEICSNFERLKIKHIGIDNLKYSYKINVSNNRNFKKCCISNEKKISHFIKKTVIFVKIRLFLAFSVKKTLFI